MVIMTHGTFTYVKKEKKGTPELSKINKEVLGPRNTRKIEKWPATLHKNIRFYKKFLKDASVAGHIFIFTHLRMSTAISAQNSVFEMYLDWWEMIDSFNTN